MLIGDDSTIYLPGITISIGIFENDNYVNTICRYQPTAEIKAIDAVEKLQCVP